jgi:hypothetical protein
VMYFQADVNAVGEALGSAVDVLNAVDLSVASLSPKVIYLFGSFRSQL